MPIADLESVLSLQKENIPKDALSKAIHAAQACKAGIPRVHVINGSLEEGLLAEVFTNEGVGTLIYGNEFQQIRRAMKKDVRSIQNLTKQSVVSEELVKRTRSTIEKQLADYYIFEIDKNPVACVALHVYPEQSKGELACLYVSPAHENQGIGKKLLQYVENRARESGLTELIALSTQAFTYFQSKGGFAEGSPDDLPPARREKYDASGRNSKVLVKKLK
jgi:amino-acid N-acetyltransferase